MNERLPGGPPVSGIISSLLLEGEDLFSENLCCILLQCRTDSLALVVLLLLLLLLFFLRHAIRRHSLEAQSKQNRRPFELSMNGVHF